MQVMPHQAENRSRLSLLKNIPMFVGLPDVQLEQLARMSVRRKVTRHTTIVRAGNRTDSLYVIMSG